MIYSFGKRSAWGGSFEYYLLLEDLLAFGNPALASHEKACSMVFDYFLVEESYREEALKTLDSMLEDVRCSPDVLPDLQVLREVYRSGPVVMG